MRGRGVRAAGWSMVCGAIGLSAALARAESGLESEPEAEPQAQGPGSPDLKPRWELGAGVAMVDFPLYRGAEERKRYWLPTPYLQYRSQYLQVDRERMRSPLLENEDVEIDLSVNGSVPVDSSGSSARRGMDDLDPTLELGPELRWVLLRDAERTARRGDTFIDLRVPLRPVFAVNTDRFEQVGWLTQPTLNAALKNVAGTGWNLGASASWLYGDAGYHRYFYDVSARDATPDRSAYRADGGSSGRQQTFSLSRMRGNLWIGAFFKHDDLRSAVFADSPLVQQRSDYSAGFAIGWIFARSSELVDVSD